MAIEIKNADKKVLHTVEGDTLRKANLNFTNLHHADLKGTDLRGADLEYADLRFAELERANLEGAYMPHSILTRACLTDANLKGAKLYYSDIRHANLVGCDLKACYLHHADFRTTNLTNANFTWADLTGANFAWADLTNANFTGADLTNANFTGADLTGAILKTAFLPHFQNPPSEGSFIAWKRLQDNVIAKLEIPADALRTGNLVGRKCRASKARVLEFQDKNGRVIPGNGPFFSLFNREFIYWKDQFAVPDSYNGDFTLECSNGIHFFMTREEAVMC